MFWLQFIGKFIKALRAGDTPGQVAGGFALGFAIGLMPFFTLHGLVLWVILLLFNFNLAAAFVAMMLTSIFAYLLDPVFHDFGYYVLTQIASLYGFYEWLYNMPAAPLTKFYNTVVMGSTLIALVLLAPVFFGFKTFVIAYRENIEERFKKTKFAHAVKGSGIYKWFDKIQRIGDL